VEHAADGFSRAAGAAGFPPESIDLVLCTHLHVDHIGWNTRLQDGRWVPTFPRARYLFARKEWEHWSTRDGDEYGPIIADSVRPVVEAGRADLVEGDHRISEELALEPTPGHTPGHVSLRVSSQGQEAVITGDLMHHPVQCGEPDWNSNFCDDQPWRDRPAAPSARATRTGRSPFSALISARPPLAAWSAMGARGDISPKEHGHDRSPHPE
jgi:glyoxylase-like metal-dependent hydrolase (beta-lactamase superfamily II)